MSTPRKYNYTESQRTEVLCLYVDRYSPAEIVRIVGISKGAVKSIIEKIYKVPKVQTLVVTEAE